MNEAPARAIVDFTRDDEGHWLAILECGHGQHLRHTPPWQNRPWVVSQAGREAHRGMRLACRKCLDGLAPVYPVRKA